MSFKVPRIAVLLIGNMRSFTVTQHSLEMFLLQHYDCDLYITTYEKRFNFKGQNMNEEMITEERIREVYGNRVKHITILEQDKFIEPYIRQPGKHYCCGGDLDRLYTIQKITLLAYEIFRGECVRNNRCYDMILKFRPDILLTARLEFNFSLTDNQIVIPNNDSGGGFNDHMAYGKNKSMARYMTYYKTFHDIDRLDDGKACDVSLIESGVRKNLEHHRIEIFRVPVPYHLLRDVKPQKVMYGPHGQFYVKKFARC
jgi:hypothetical protein